MIMDLHVTMLARILLGIDTVVHRIMLYVAEIALLVMVCIVTATSSSVCSSRPWAASPGLRRLPSS